MLQTIAIWYMSGIIRFRLSKNENTTVEAKQQKAKTKPMTR